VPFAPHEIENKKFVIALRGYQTGEVDGFLRAVAADYRAALDAAAARAAEPVQQHPAPEAGEARELVAEIERVMDGARARAGQEAAEIIAAAEREAAAIREAVALESEACYAEINRQAELLGSTESHVRQQLQALEYALVEAKQAMGNLPPLPLAP
jgi:DivIVA domain-containing protein